MAYLWGVPSTFGPCDVQGADWILKRALRTQPSHFQLLQRMQCCSIPYLKMPLGFFSNWTTSQCHLLVLLKWSSTLCGFRSAFCSPLNKDHALLALFSQIQYPVFWRNSIPSLQFFKVCNDLENLTSLLSKLQNSYLAHWLCKMIL